MASAASAAIRRNRLPPGPVLITVVQTTDSRGGLYGSSDPCWIPYYSIFHQQIMREQALVFICNVE
ncbi:hypothetical protein CGRA01v4_00160 [Colletotrichum graminicola]|nr:hypothetical protein CGRA01v4_00160 [Colletotrichum graminicola]